MEHFGHRLQDKHRVMSTRVFKSGPPVPLDQEEVLSTTKTEELTKKKKTDTLVTKQIETRVRREIVVTDDGDIIEDSGPTVTTETTENTRTEEQENTECKTKGQDNPGPGWILVPGSKVVNETRKKNETTNKTREERTDTEITEEIGGFTRSEITRALKQREQAALKARLDSLSSRSPTPSSRSQVVHQSSHKIVDTEETDEVSEYKDGSLNKETKKKSNRVEFFDGDVDDDDKWSPKVMDNKETDNPRRPSSTETFNWVNHHFGSQDDLDVSRITLDDEVDVDVDCDDDGGGEDTSSGRHYTKRQQLPSMGPLKPPRTPKKSSENSISGNRPYHQGDDPKIGQRFSTMTTQPSNTKYVPTKFSTFGRDHDHSSSREPNNAGAAADTVADPPTVTDIIHSLRSKAFLEKESAAVSIRDDDSVINLNGSSRTSIQRQHPVKQHIIKISIRSDDSDCSTLSSRNGHLGLQKGREVPVGGRGGSGLVKNAINSLMKNRLNSNCSSTSRTCNGSNLTSTKTYLTSSSPNVNKMIERETWTKQQQPIKQINNFNNNNRSQSIGNLNIFNDRLSSPMSSGYGTYSSSRDGVTRMNVGSPVISKRPKNHQRQSPDYYYKYSASPVWSSTSGTNSPPSSPSYTNRIKLPSPIPPSSTTSTISPRSPPPPLTRPYSPYDRNSNSVDDYRDLKRTMTRSSNTLPTNRTRSSSSVWIDQSRSPSPPAPPLFVRRPPSPVLPTRSTSGSLVDDAASIASTNRSSRSTNPGSRAGSLEGVVPNPKERVVVNNRKKVTTTTVKRREIELPETDYFNDKGILDRNKSRSIVHIGFREDWNET